MNMCNGFVATCQIEIRLVADNTVLQNASERFNEWNDFNGGGFIAGYWFVVIFLFRMFLVTGI